MSNSQRDRAEAAFGHVQQAATEMIRAAHETLDILEEAVTTAAFGSILHRLNEVGESLLARAAARPGRWPPAPNPPPWHEPRPGGRAASDRATAPATTPAGPDPAPGAPDSEPASAAEPSPVARPRPAAPAPPRHQSRVERIPVR